MLTIKNFGHYWSRDLIEWGGRGRGNQGHLKGIKRRSSTEPDTDFRNQIGIYVLYGKNREIVYAGQAGRGNYRLFNRLKDHSGGSMRDRWTNFSWFGFLDVDDNGGLVEAEDPSAAVQGSHTAALNETEAVLLQVLEPRLNKQGPRWNGVTEYYQYSEWENTTMDDLWDRLELILNHLDIDKGE